MTIFDIETEPDLEAVARVTPPFDREAVLCGNMKDPALIAAKKEKAEADYWQSAHEKAALKPETSRIVALGIHFPGSPPEIITHPDEAEILAEFWTFWQESHAESFGFFSGNNGRGRFDVRHLLVRSWVNGVEVPEDALDLSVRGRWVDLAERFLTAADSNSYCSANAAAKTLGLIGRDLGWAIVQDKDSLPVTGHYFHQALKDSPESAIAYLRNDLAIERALADVLYGAAA